MSEQTSVISPPPEPADDTQRGFMQFFDKIDLSRLFRLESLAVSGWRHIYLLPLDILVIIFISQTMLPAWAVVPLAFVNFGTWWCYYRIPQFLRTVSGREGQSILIPGPIVEYFARFINSCGVHHRAHYGLMLAMMAGFHASMTGSMFGGAVGANIALVIAWAAYTGLLIIDAAMYGVSLRTLRELRRDKLQEANRYTEDLRRSNQDLEQFAYIASHDLRAPLRAILNLSNWIRDDIGDRCSPDTKEHLDLLQKRVQRLDLLLNDLLQYSRIGREETKKELIDLHALTREIFESLDGDKDHQLTIAGDPVTIEDYRVTYELLLANLISNALKHHDKEQCSIEIAFQRIGDEIEIKVEDDGPGIPAEYREKIFKVFATLKPRDQKEASGMGLAIVKKIVTHKKGYIDVGASESGGASFTIRMVL